MRASLILLFCLVPLFVEAQPTSLPASASTSSQSTPALSLPPAVEEDTRLFRPGVPLYLATGAFVGGWAAGWKVALNLSEDFELGVVPDPVVLQNATLAASLGRVSMNAAFFSLCLARYQQTKKLRTLYAATGLTALRAAGRTFFLFASAAGGLDEEVENPGRDLVVNSGIVGAWTAFAVGSYFLTWATIKTIKYKKADRPLWEPF